jgi:hypothetical protein
MASITGDGGSFSVGRVVVRRMTGQESVDPSELPPGHKGKPPKQNVWEEVADSDGSQPVSTEAGDILDVYVAATMPSDAVGEIHGNLLLNGDSGPVTTVALTAICGGITASLLGPVDSVAQGQSVNVALAITSLQGSQDTDVIFDLVGGRLNPGDDVGISLRALTIHLPGGSSKVVSLVLDVGSQVNVGQRQLTLEVRAPKAAGDTVPLTLTVTPASPRVAVLVGDLTVLSGRNFTVPVRINLGSLNGIAEVTFTLGVHSPGVSMAV